MSSQRITADQANTERVILLDRINVLVMFDETGKDCEEAMALMARHSIDADELNARRNNGNRPFYTPEQPQALSSCEAGRQRLASL